MAKLRPFLWFAQDLAAPLQFYSSVFPDAAIVAPAGIQSSDADAGIVSATLSIAGQELLMLAGGPQYQFNPAISMFLECSGQAELDRYWDALLEGGAPVQCGWLVDRFGLSWQVVPSELGQLLADPDPVRSRRVTEAMLKMVKIDVAGLRRAWEG
jgi:predicted 3-demethylubiquinone-9 3-methyltransferase (glyoxalase superfamily)